MKNKFYAKKLIVLLFALAFFAFLTAGCGGKDGPNGRVVVYNWGEYIDPDVLKMFEKETGIRVIYDEYETNEIMFPKIESGSSNYDVLCPSDYMIQKLLENDLLREINFANVPNAKEHIGAEYFERSLEFDPTGTYSVPYKWGTVGILYNEAMVSGPIDSWAVLWEEQYSDSILMQDSVRDAFMVALKLNGFSLNSMDENELLIARDALIAQKPLVQAYVIDQVRDKMIGGEAALGVIYSGEALYTRQENPDLAFVIPKEGTNVWIDSWVITKNAANPDNAETFINFMCRPDIALMNFEYITYSTPNDTARSMIEDPEIRYSEVAFPNLADFYGLETYRFLGAEGDELYNQLWKEIKSW